MTTKWAGLPLLAVLVCGMQFIDFTRPLFALTDDELFEQVFGSKPSAQIVPLVVRLRIGDRDAGVLPVQFNPVRNKLHIPVEILSERTAPYWAEEITALIHSLADNDGYVTLETLKENGFDARYNPTLLILSLREPVRNRAVTEIYLRKPAEDVNAALLEPPAAISQYLNITTRADLQNGRQDLSLVLEEVLKINDVIIRADGRYGLTGGTFLLNRAQLVRDDEAHRIRYFAGDIDYPVIGLLNNERITGIGVSGGTFLYPGVLVQRMSRYEFIAEKPVQVDIRINGILKKTFSLEPGRYDLRHFPLEYGHNTVDIILRDDLGRSETLHTTMVRDPQLLAEGEHAFSYNLGFPGEFDSRARTIRTDYPTAVMFHKYGITDRLTLSPYLKANGLGVVSGLSSLWGVAGGLLKIDPAFSMQPGTVAGLALNADFQSRTGIFHENRPAGWEWGMLMEYNNGTFLAPPGQPAGESRFFLAPNLFIRFPDRWNMQLQAAMTASGNSLASLAASVGFLKQWPLLTAEVFFQWTEKMAEGSEWDVFARFRIYLDYRNPVTMQFHTKDTPSVTYRYGLSPTTALTTEYSNDRNYAFESEWNERILKSRLEVQRRDGKMNYFGNLYFEGNRNHLFLSHNQDEGGGYHTVIQSASSLVYADGHFAIGAPIRSHGFALMVPDDSLKGAAVSFSPAGKISMFGPAVIPVFPYTLNTIMVSRTENLPTYFLDKKLFKLRPVYESGTLITVGSGNNILVQGILIDQFGQPVALEAAELRARNGRSEPQVVFTNRRGRFVFTDVSPGVYDLFFYNPELSALEVVIEKAEDAVITKQLTVIRTKQAEPEKTQTILEAEVEGPR